MPENPTYCLYLLYYYYRTKIAKNQLFTAVLAQKITIYNFILTMLVTGPDLCDKAYNKLKLTANKGVGVNVSTFTRFRWRYAAVR